MLHGTAGLCLLELSFPQWFSLFPCQMFYLGSLDDDIWSLLSPSLPGGLHSYQKLVTPWIETHLLPSFSRRASMFGGKKVLPKPNFQQHEYVPSKAQKPFKSWMLPLCKVICDAKERSLGTRARMPLFLFKKLTTPSNRNQLRHLDEEHFSPRTSTNTMVWPEPNTSQVYTQGLFCFWVLEVPPGTQSSGV